MLQILTPTKPTGRTVWPPVASPPHYPIIMLITGGYQIDLGPRSIPRFHLVLKNRTCNCGASNCRGKHAVKVYLKAGGKPAPDGSALKYTTGPCPICNDQTRVVDGRWDCLSNSTHYWDLYHPCRGWIRILYRAIWHHCSEPGGRDESSVWS